MITMSGLDLKVCANCVWCQPKKKWQYILTALTILMFLPPVEQCGNPKCDNVDLVTGKRYQVCCEGARLDDDKCGPDASYFTPKET